MITPHALKSKQSVPNLVVGVQTCCLDQYTSYGAGNMYDKFQGRTVDVQDSTLIVKQPYSKPFIMYTQLMYATKLCMMLVS